MSQARSCDLAIIGSGPGGYVAALYAARHKLKTFVIEKDLVGGTCLNRGCMPTKSMLHSASVLGVVKTAMLYGVHTASASIDFPKVIARKNEVVTRLRSGIEMLFKANGIIVVNGFAKIISRTAIDAGGEVIECRNMIIAAGSEPSGLPGLAFDEKKILSSNGALSMETLPSSIAIIGGGVIGCEFASIFNAFGVNVTVIEAADRIVPSQSREASKKLETVFKKRGVVVLTGVKVESFQSAGAQSLVLSDGKNISPELVLVSTGRKPVTGGMGLEESGIRMEDGHVQVGATLETSLKGVYAIGDCVKGPKLAHKASYDGILAVDNILGKSRAFDYSNIPSCVYTEPEIASVGMVEEEARSRYPEARIAKFPFMASGKAYVEGKSDGFIKLIGDSSGLILGAEIFGKGACDLISEIAVARAAGMKIQELSMVTHGHPTISEVVQEAGHIFAGTPIHSL